MTLDAGIKIACGWGTVNNYYIVKSFNLGIVYSKLYMYMNLYRNGGLIIFMNLQTGLLILN